MNVQLTVDLEQQIGLVIIWVGS